MADLANAFIAIPGGFGTLEELLEVVTWNQIGFMVKPVGILNVCGYFDHLLKFFDHAVQEVHSAPSCCITALSSATLLDSAIDCDIFTSCTVCPFRDKCLLCPACPLV